MNLTLDHSVSISNDVVFRELDDESVLLNLTTGIYFGLDRIGTRIWQLIAEQGRLSAVAAALSEEYDVSREVAVSDLLRLAQELNDRGLLDAHLSP